MNHLLGACLLEEQNMPKQTAKDHEESGNLENGEEGMNIYLASWRRKWAVEQPHFPFVISLCFRMVKLSRTRVYTWFLCLGSIINVVIIGQAERVLFLACLLEIWLVFY